MKIFITLTAMAFSMLFIMPAPAKAEAEDGTKPTLRTALVCPLSNGENAVFKIKTYYKGTNVAPVIEVNGRLEKLDFTADSKLLGEVEMYRCVHNTLIVVWDTGSPYNPGVAIRANPKTHVIERLDFSEKNLPHWVYLDDNKMLIVIRNFFYFGFSPEGRSEYVKKYIIYRYASGKGPLDANDDPPQANQLPTPSKYLYRIR